VFRGFARNAGIAGPFARFEQRPKKERGMADYKDDSVREEAAGFGERIKGGIKEGAGAISGDESLRREGQYERAEGNMRQENNNVLDESDGVRGATAGGSTYNTSGRGRLVTGLYRTREEAERAYGDLTTRHGYKPDDVSVLMSDETRRKHWGDDVTPGKELQGEGNKAMEGMGIGSAVGGTLGAIIGAIAAIGTSIVFPGLGLVIAGPLAAAFAGAGAGGATGGLLGALVGAGIPEDRAKEYEQGLNEGGIVIGTNARDEAHAAQLEQDYANYGGTNVRR
jgi:uncharacterized protein YjbJ (UPF0337 family)